MTANSRHIPGSVRRKVPSALLGIADARTLIVVLGLGLALLMIYGPLVGQGDHNGWRYLLAPLVYPWVPAAYYIFRPVRPYSGYRGRWNNLGGLIDKDQSDLEAARLTALFQSAEARRYMVRTALRMSVILFVPLAVATLALGESVSWRPYSQWLFFSATCGVIGCTVAFFAETLHWGITTWAREASPR